MNTSPDERIRISLSLPSDQGMNLESLRNLLRSRDVLGTDPEVTRVELVVDPGGVDAFRREPGLLVSEQADR
jgi:hypothetical protein